MIVILHNTLKKTDYGNSTWYMRILMSFTLN